MRNGSGGGNAARLRHVSGSEGELTVGGAVVERVGDWLVLVGSLDPQGVLRDADGDVLGGVLPGGILADADRQPLGRVDRQGRVFVGAEQIGQVAVAPTAGSASVTGEALARAGAALLLLPPRESAPQDHWLPSTLLVLLPLLLLISAFGAFWVWTTVTGLAALTAFVLAEQAARALPPNRLARLRPALRYTRRSSRPVGVDSVQEHAWRPLLPYRLLPLLPGGFLQGLATLIGARLPQILTPLPPISAALSLLLAYLVAERVARYRFRVVALARKRDPDAYPPADGPIEARHLITATGSAAALLGVAGVAVALTPEPEPPAPKAPVTAAMATAAPATPATSATTTAAANRRPMVPPMSVPVMGSIPVSAPPPPAALPVATPPVAARGEGLPPGYVPTTVLGAETARRQLTEGELVPLDAYTLDRLRNEIYARHGFAFGSHRPDLIAFFRQQPWYRPDAADSDSVFYQRLSDVERYNVVLIRTYQESSGKRYRYR